MFVPAGPPPCRPENEIMAQFSATDKSSIGRAHPVDTAHTETRARQTRGLEDSPRRVRDRCEMETTNER